MSDAKLVNIARLMTTYNLEIEQLPEDLKCAQCKLVLKDACQLPCCCRFCCVCIDDMIKRGDQFCLGNSEDCGESLLSRFVLHYEANKRISRLTVKCPHDGCVHESQLVNIEQHLRECPRKSEECPFRELGCTQDTLAAEKMAEHLQHENRRHSEILIVMIANINREIETLKQRDEVRSKEIESLKQRDEVSSREIETLKQRDEISSKEIETLKQRDEVSSREIETLKQRDEVSSRVIETLKQRDEVSSREIESRKQRDEVSSREIESLKQRDEVSSREIESLKQRDEVSSREIETLKQRDEVSSRDIETLKQRDDTISRYIETLKHKLNQKDGQIRSIMDQMIHVQNDIKSIKEQEDLAAQVRILTDKIAEIRKNDELNSTKVKEHVNTEIAAVTRLIGSNKDKLFTEMQSVKCNIESLKQSVKSQVQSVQALMGLGQFDASFVWLIDMAVDKTYWDRHSEYFTGEEHPYKYRLRSVNTDRIGTAGAALYIRLRIYASPNDGQLAWPFEARVVITVTDRDRREVCQSISLQCQIERPPDKDCRWSGAFTFLHSELINVGINLRRGVRVSCVIFRGT